MELDHKKKYSEIIELGNGEQLVSFFKKLNAEDRRALIPSIKQDIKRLYTTRELSRRIWGYAGTREQLNMLSIAMFVCYGKAERKLIKPHLLPADKQIDNILSWYQPEWFNQYINELSNQEYIPIQYESLADWIAKGYLLDVYPELIAQKMVLDVSCLEKYPFILDKHIWFIFQYPNTISWSDYWSPKENKPIDADDRKWIYIFKKIINNKLINRMQVLKECLLSVNRNFDKNQTNWYADLFVALEPTVEECIQLQNELFSVFHCPQSKPINVALSMIKKINAQPKFSAGEFIAYMPLLLSYETKGIVNNTLMIADSLAKRSPEFADDIAVLLPNTFLSKDQSLQTKAAKLIVKYANPADQNLIANICDYIDNLLMDTRLLLKDFLEIPTVVAESSVYKEKERIRIELIREDNRIPEISTWDDFVFLLGHVFFNAEPYHFDQLPTYLLQFSGQINEDTVQQLEPAFLQAYKTIDIWNSTIGFLDRISAAFFLEYGRRLIARYPAQTRNLQKLADKYKHITFSPENWKTSKMEKYIPYMDIFSYVLEQLSNNSRLPLLSTPTHLPCFIDPMVLAERLYLYQQQNVEPSSFDLQLALQRCALDADLDKLKPVLKTLKGDAPLLLSYLLSGDAGCLDKAANKDWKLAAVITRYGYSPDETAFNMGCSLLETNNIPIELMTQILPWQINCRKQNVSILNNESKDVFTKKLRIDIADYSLKVDSPLFYQYMCASYSYSSFEWSADNRRRIFSCPYVPDIILRRFISSKFECSDIKEVKAISEVLQTIYQLPFPLTDTSYLLIALSMLHGDKTIRTLAGEIWIDKLGQYSPVNNQLIGDIIGTLEKEEWAPLKRFTDLASQTLVGVNPDQNKALEVIVSNILSHLSETNIANYKKLVMLHDDLKARIQ